MCTPGKRKFASAHMILRKRRKANVGLALRCRCIASTIGEEQDKVNSRGRFAWLESGWFEMFSRMAVFGIWLSMIRRPPSHT